MLELKNVHKRFNLEEGLFAGYGRFIYAVNGVSFLINQGETYGLVGESGCGKSTISRLIAGIYAGDEGEINIHLNDGALYRQGKENDKKRVGVLRQAVRYIFQDPAKSLDPKMTVGAILTEGYRFTPNYPGKKKALEEAAETLELVGLSVNDLSRRPSEFSGGQRQRISIARALITKPQLLICDEVVSALDVSVQSQIINLLIDIKNRYGITMLFISHDLTLVSYISDRVAVMYGGMIMEEGASIDILEKHVHPYTSLLYSSVAEGGTLESKMPDESPDITEPLAGCPFYSRCPKRIDRCKNEIPVLKPAAVSPIHKAACHCI